MNAIAPAHDRVRCRPMLAGDIEGVVGLLRRGFPTRPEAFWRRGLARMSQRQVPDDLPRFGYLLECEKRIVGVLLLLFSRVAEDGQDVTRCNLSSWCVEQSFRAHAAQLVVMATRRKDVTFTNISAARHTWTSIEAQGFRRFSDGLFFAVPGLGPRSQNAKVHVITPGTPPPVVSPDNGMLDAHAAYGCISLLVEADDGLFPFVFLPFRIRSGRVWLPTAHLLYCPDLKDFSRFAGRLAWPLLKCGVPIVMVDASAPIVGLRGVYRPNCRPKYTRGPHAPRLGDLAFSELALFGA